MSSPLPSDRRSQYPLRMSFAPFAYAWYRAYPLAGVGAGASG